MIDMVYHQFLPGVEGYMNELADTIIKKKQAVSGVSCKAEEKTLQIVSDNYDKIYDLVEKLKADTEKAETIADSLQMADFYKDTIIADMESLRAVADATEEIIPEDALPYPSYGKILFYV